MNAKAPVAIACGIWIRDGLLFMQSRPKGKVCEGAWEFPGGKIEEGETEEEALAREFAEELGLEVSVGRRLGEVVHAYPHATVRVAFFLVRSDGRPEPREGQEFGFFAKERLPEGSLPTVAEALALL